MKTRTRTKRRNTWERDALYALAQNPGKPFDVRDMADYVKSNHGKNWHHRSPRIFRALIERGYVKRTKEGGVLVDRLHPQWIGVGEDRAGIMSAYDNRQDRRSGVFVRYQASIDA